MRDVPVNINRLSAEISNYLKGSAEYLKARKNYRKSLMLDFSGIFLTVILFVFTLGYMAHSSGLIYLLMFICASILLVAMAIVQTIRISRARVLYQVNVSELAGEYIENYIKGLNDNGLK